jgi:hypothetical protein
MNNTTSDNDTSDPVDRLKKLVVQKACKALEDIGNGGSIQNAYNLAKLAFRVTSHHNDSKPVEKQPVISTLIRSSKNVSNNEKNSMDTNSPPPPPPSSQVIPTTLSTIHLPDRDYVPETLPLENSDSSDYDSEEELEEDQSERTKAIRRKHRDLLSLTFKRLMEAPDTEYICLICLTDKSEEVLDPTKVLMTACGHLFHRFCIKKWVKDAREQEKDAHNLCPACRTDIVAFHRPESKLNSQETDAVQTPKE